jgi:hypothetical protein
MRGRAQFLMKVLRIAKLRNSELGLQNEYANTYLTSIEVAMIRNATRRYEQNFKFNCSRYSQIQDLFKLSVVPVNRIGPGVVLSFRNIESQCELDKIELPEGVLFRHFDFSRSNDAEATYLECIYVPIHSGIPNALFEKYLEFLSKYQTRLEICEI